MEEILIFGHKNPDTDTIMSSIAMENLEKKMGKENIKAYRLGEINKETKYALEYFGVEAPNLLEEVKDEQKVILVDHNGFGQSVKGIEKAKILKVIDHHNISEFRTSEPVFYIGMPVGCTSTILYSLYKINNIEIEPKIAGLMLSAIISDTLLFKSPTCTPKDKEVAEELAKIANVKIEEYGMNMLKAGADISDFTPSQMINIDSKPFVSGGIKYQVAQINTVDIDEVLKNKEKLEEEMNRFINQNNQHFFILLITDILENNSEILCVGEKLDIIEKAFNTKLHNNKAFLKGVVSRKKQVIPSIEKICN